MKTGDTVTVVGTENHGIVVDMYSYNGQSKVKVFFTRKTPPITYNRHEVKLYHVESSDLVLLMSDHGVLYPSEVTDVTADRSAVYVYDLDGERYRVPMSEVSRVIPASVARVRGLTKGE